MIYIWVQDLTVLMHLGLNQNELIKTDLAAQKQVMVMVYGIAPFHFVSF